MSIQYFDVSPLTSPIRGNLIPACYNEPFVALLRSDKLAQIVKNLSRLSHLRDLALGMFGSIQGFGGANWGR